MNVQLKLFLSQWKQMWNVFFGSHFYSVSYKNTHTACTSCTSCAHLILIVPFELMQFNTKVYTHIFFCSRWSTSNPTLWIDGRMGLNFCFLSTGIWSKTF